MVKMEKKIQLKLTLKIQNEITAEGKNPNKENKIRNRSTKKQTHEICKKEQLRREKKKYVVQVINDVRRKKAN